MKTIILAYSLGLLSVALIGAVVYYVRLNKKVNDIAENEREREQSCNDEYRHIHSRIEKISAELRQKK